MVENEPQHLSSPDGQIHVTARVKEEPKDPNGFHVLLTVRTKEKIFHQHLSGWGSEISWSSDSKAFFVTQTEGGGGMGYRTYVFFVDENSVKKVDVSRPVELAHGYSKQCEIKIYPNVVAIAWLEGSSRLLLAAETVPVSICKCAGAFKAYEVKLPENTIIQTFSQSETKRLFPRLLGCELRDAEGKCSIDPVDQRLKTNN
jgi:hypothetical protein